MVSKRKFFSIATMMFVLFFLFQFSMVLRDSKNTYDINSSLTEKKADGRNRWTPSDKMCIRDRYYNNNQRSDDTR